MDSKPAGSIYVPHDSGGATKVNLVWKTDELRYIQNCTKELNEIIKREELPFKLHKGKFDYTGPKGKVEDYVLDLYEMILFEKPELAENLDGTFENTIPAYAEYIKRTNDERRLQRKIGNIECDGHNFHITEKALDEISHRRSLMTDTAAYCSLLPEVDSLKEKLKSLGISLEKSKSKAILGGLLMVTAGALGAAIAKDVCADSPDDDTHSRQTNEPVYIANGYSPDWSPDGKQVVIGYYDIDVVNKDGTNKEEIISAGNMGHEAYCDPDWSPDGEKIVFYDFYGYEIYTADKDGNNMKKIGQGINPRWSPNGLKIVYEYSDSIKTMNSDGSNDKAILSMNELCGDTAPSYSPDGSKIAFNTEHGLYVMNSDGTNAKKIFDCGDKYCYYPIWSPDGKEILFEQAEGWEDPSGLYTLNSDGTDLEKIIDLVAGGASADWFGSTIVYSDFDNGIYKVYYLDIGKGQMEWKDGDYFIHLTDTHVYKDNKRLEDFVTHVNAMEEKPKFIVVSGDLVDWGAGDSGSQNFEQFMQTMNRLETTWYVVPGNHDCRYGVGGTSLPVPLEGDKFENYDNLIPSSRDLTTGKADYGNVVVFGLNSGWDELNLNTSPFPPEGSGLSNTQISSLEEKLDMLDGVKDSKDSSGKRKVIIMHHPTYWQNKQGKDDGVFQHNRDEFTRICKQYGVDVVLAGHTHEGAVRDDGTKFVVSGAAGEDAVYRKITYSEKGLKVEDQQIFKETTTGKIDCPAKLTMYDSTGRKVNSEAKELSGAYFSGWEINGDRTETASAYGTGEYTFEIKGMGNGTINFTINENGKTILSTDPLPITDKTTLKFTTLENKVHVGVDKDSDGKLEKEFDVSDGRLTKDEFEKGKDTPKGDQHDAVCYAAGAAAASLGPLMAVVGWYYRWKKRKQDKRKKKNK